MRTHIDEHLDALPFMTRDFLSVLDACDLADLSIELVNKIYAVLGSLEFKGIAFTDYASVDSGDESDLYKTADFFETLYLTNQVAFSGLPAMVY